MTGSKRSSSLHSVTAEDVDKPLHGKKDMSKGHPVEYSNFLSFATFSWISGLMYKAYKNGLSTETIPYISDQEICSYNASQIEKLWGKERAFTTHPKPSFGRVLWRFSRKRICWATIAYMTCIILGFIGPTMLMKRLLEFASSSESTFDGGIWASLLVACEFGRVFFQTLTWAISYRTALRQKAAVMGLVYRKLFKLGTPTEVIKSKILNVISSDCNRMYEVITAGQLAIGGPVVLLLCVGYVIFELGWLSLLGLMIFPLSYPLQYIIAKGSGSLRRKAISVKDLRMNLLTQAAQSLKFLKMFAWEEYFHKFINDSRSQEKNYLLKSQLLHSFSVVLGPTLPHVGAIITFILYISSGNNLTPAQAFCIVALFVGRIRPTLNTMRSGFRCYFEGRISLSRITCFTLLFMFVLFSYSIRSVSQLTTHWQTFKISNERMESVLLLPEINDVKPVILIQETNNNSLDETVVMEDVMIIRKVVPEAFTIISNQKSTNFCCSSNGKKHAVDGPSDKKPCNSIERLLENSETDPIAFKLDHLDVRIQKGKFIGLCGNVGTGKTTFLEAIAGSIRVDRGHLNVQGSMAYVAQKPWTFKGTLRDNIIFGEPFDSVWYYKCISDCCLINDFAVFPQGDLTETDGNANNLSGGQKQRLSLARAIYHARSRDLFLLDDPFSGLDSRVAKTVFENAVMKQLKQPNKTVILATHQLQYLRNCDEILVFSEGSIYERGSHEQLMGFEGSLYSQMYSKSCTEGVANDENLSLEEMSVSTPDRSMTKNSRNIYKNLSSKGKVRLGVYALYLKSAGGVLSLLLIFIAFGLSVASLSYSSWWLKSWFKSAPTALKTNEDMDDFLFENVTTSEPPFTISQYDFHKEKPRVEIISADSPDFVFNRNVYAGIIGVIFATSLFRTILFAFTTIKASQGLHTQILNQFFANRLNCLSNFGIGHILNLFSRDMDEVDNDLPHTMEYFLQNSFVISSIIILISLVFPVFLVPLVILFLIFVFIRRVYNCAVRDLKRFETESKTPILNCLNETLNGLGTIRAYGKEAMMIQKFDKKVDWSHSVKYTFCAAVRWFALRLDCLAVLITGVTALLIILLHGNISAAACGLALSYAAQLSGLFQYTVRLASETEAKFVSVERFRDFLKFGVSEEEDLFCCDSINNGSGSLLPAHSLNNWPFAGHVIFQDATVQYDNDSLPALKEVSFEVQSGQKIGIIGRTGSGKSSIGNVLFRLNELSKGKIIIDDIDISSIPLTKLRESLCVIPQEPIVYQQSVRFNLDPGKKFTDPQIWSALEKTGLKTSIEKLDTEPNLSHGQQQLLSIARALLHKSKVVFVDEATSNVDATTSQVIDKLLIEEFQYSTVFIIAHRLSALTYCDYLLVMENGEVRDFGPAAVVKSKPEFSLCFEKFETIPL